METMQSSIKLRGQVLNQVYRVWLFRRLLPVVVAEIIILSLVLYQIAQVVFIQRVLENGLDILFVNPPRLFSFFVSMFTKATLGTRILGFAVIVLVALILRHLTQGLLRLFLVRENYFSKVRQ